MSSESDELNAKLSARDDEIKKLRSHVKELKEELASKDEAVASLRSLVSELEALCRTLITAVGGDGASGRGNQNTSSQNQGASSVSSSGAPPASSSGPPRRPPPATRGPPPSLMSRNGNRQMMNVAPPSPMLAPRNPLLTIIDRSDRGLSSLESDMSIFETLATRRLYLNQNQLSNLPSDVSQLTALEHLNLGHNCFRELPEDSLIVLSRLRELVLTGNRLTRLDKLPKSLEKLDLMNNCIEGDPFAALDSGAEYLELNLRRNRLTRIEPISAKKLRQLDVGENRLGGLSPALLEAHELTILEADGNSLTHLFGEVEKSAYSSMATSWSSMTELHLQNNQLVALPDELGQLPALRLLDVSNNRLKELPSGFGSKLKSLETLLLQRNQINSLSNAGLGQCTTLVGLDLTRNTLTELPADIFPESCSLVALAVGHNKLCELPETLGNCCHLERLSAFGNQLSRMPLASLHRLTQLSELFVSYNSLSNPQSSPDEKLSLPESLVELHISGNRELGGIPEHWLRGCSNLQQLYADGVGASSLPIALFDEKELGDSLERLHIACNALSELPPSIGQLGALQHIHAAANSFKQIPTELSECSMLETVDLVSNESLSGPLPEPLLEMAAPGSGRLHLFLDNSVVGKFAGQLRLPMLLKRRRGMQVGVAEIIGRRPSQEDAMISYSFDESDEVDSPCTGDLFCIFDGHAGADAAQYCGNHFHEALSQALTAKKSKQSQEESGSEKKKKASRKSDNGTEGGDNAEEEDEDDGDKGETTPDDDDELDDGSGTLELRALRASFGRMQNKVEKFVNTLDPMQRHCGTTAGCIWLPSDSGAGKPPRRVLAANLGDTRAVLCRGGKAVRLTHDHKPLDEEERIRALGGYVIGKTTQRVQGTLGVARSLGDFFMRPYVSCEPYVNEIELTAEDEFIILACDGVWDEIGDQLAVDLVRAEKEPTQAAVKLRDFAYLEGSDDNITVMIINLKERK